MNARKSNFRTALVSTGVCVVLLLAISALTINRNSDFIKRRPSTYFTDKSGARAILLVFQALLPGTDQWRRPFLDLPARMEMRHASLVVMGPSEPLSVGEAAAFDRWIKAGGQLILANGEDWKIRKPLRSGQEKEEFEEAGFLARHGMQATPGFPGPDATSAAVTQSVGAGRIIYVPDAYAFSNETLRRQDNAVWLATRATEWGNRVSFDEYHHGFGEKRDMMPLIGMFLISPWGLVSLQLLLAGIVYMVGTRRRFGRPLEELPVARTSPIEAIEALGGLFETARASALSVKTFHQYLNLDLTALLGYPVDISNPVTRDRIASRSTLGKAALDEYAGAVRKAQEADATPDTELIRLAHQATMISRSFRHGNARQQSGRPAIAG